MLYEEERDVNQAGYERMRGLIDQAFPKGRFVALGEGEIIADAESYDALDERLNALGWEPLKTMVIRAGDETPDFVEILAALTIEFP